MDSAARPPSNPPGMMKRALLYPALLAAALALGPSLCAAPYDWQGTASSAQSWSLPANWVQNSGFPGAADDATFVNPTTPFLVALGTLQSAQSLNFNMPVNFTVNGGTLNLGYSSTLGYSINHLGANNVTLNVVLNCGPTCVFAGGGSGIVRLNVSVIQSAWDDRWRDQEAGFQRAGTRSGIS
jgi:hypothetical protein